MVDRVVNVPRSSIATLARIEDPHVQILEISLVSGDECQTVHSRRGSEEGVDDRKCAHGTEAAPFIRHQRIDRKHPIGVEAAQVVEPPIPYLRTRCIAPAKLLDALSNLSERDHTEEQGVGRLVGRGRAASQPTSALAGCVRSEGGSTTTSAPPVASSTVAILAVPLGDTAGPAEIMQAATMANPYAGNKEAIQQGRDLFVRMNCAGCHGYDAKGAMGPNLTDGYWRYGGVPVSVFKSIYQGRPQGMPAWSPALPPSDIWKLVSYIESLGGTLPASDYLASVQGDHPGENVAPEVTRTLPESGQATAPTAVGATSSPPEARPDAGGKP